MVRQAPRCFDSALLDTSLKPCSAKPPGPTRLPGEVSAYSQIPESRNLWEEIGQKSPVSTFRFPSMGPKSRGCDHPRSCDRRANRIDNRMREHRRFHPRQFEIIPDCARVVFCTHASRSVDKFFADRLSTRLVTVSLSTVHRENGCRSLRHPRSRDFLPLDQPKSNAVPRDGNERPAQPPGSKRRLGLPTTARVAGSWADLVKVTSEREDAVVDEAHRNRIRTMIPNILTFKSFPIL